MSFLHSSSRVEELGSAYYTLNSITYDILTQQHSGNSSNSGGSGTTVVQQHSIMSPPLTPEANSKVSPRVAVVNQGVPVLDANGEVMSRSGGGMMGLYESGVRVGSEVNSPVMGEHYSNYVQVRGGGGGGGGCGGGDVTSKKSCYCCPQTSLSMVNGAHVSNKHENCSQPHSYLPNNEYLPPTNERLPNHFFGSPPRTVFRAYNNNNPTLNNDHVQGYPNNVERLSHKNTNPINSPINTPINNINNLNNMNLRPPSEHSAGRKRKLSEDDGPYSTTRRKGTGDQGIGEEVACEIQGHLSLPGSGKGNPKHTITVGELQRRVNQPECLTKVDMIAYVRSAKNKARSLLDDHNIKTNQHNQRSEHTVLSKMCESEAKWLANGIHEMNCRYFPTHWSARKSVEEILKITRNSRQQREELALRLENDKIARNVLLDFYVGLSQHMGNEQMKVFNHISHDFGVLNIQNHLRFLLQYLEEEISVLDGRVRVV